MVNQKETTVHFKSLIDEQLMRIALYSGHNTEELAKLLTKIKPTKKEGPWAYLLKAVRKTKFFLQSDKLEKKIRYKWIYPILWDQKEILSFYPRVCSSSDEIDPDDYDSNYIIIKNYPKESHEALKTGIIVAGHDADLIVLWKNEDGTSKVCHVHPENFNILGKSIPEFIKNELDKSLK